MKKFAAEQLQEVISDCVLRVDKEPDKERRQLLVEATEKLLKIVDKLLVEEPAE
jgi:hypothetical protein